MVAKRDFRRIEPFIWELPADYDPRMRVPARLIADERLLEAALGDEAVRQLINVAMLPGIVAPALAMPDIHQGYGFPIGGVAAFRLEEGIVSPGGVGYDINCGVRLLAASVDAEAIAPHLDALATALYRNCPSGLGKKGLRPLSYRELDAVLEEGAEWALRHGLAERDDLLRTESGGRLEGARAGAVPDRAKTRGRPQLGSLGAGNHFLEVDVVEQVFDAQIAQAFGLREGGVAVQIHCGSRGLGHEVCAQFIRRLQGVPQRYGFDLPDRELIAAPLDSPEGRDYLAAMAAAANYAFANRQVLAHCVRRTFEEVLAGKVRRFDLRQVYDVAHNIAKIERHTVEGRSMELIVHRKGATRAFPPGHPDLPAFYRKTGQPVLVPGSMGTASWVLAGTKRAMEVSFGSTCHGAGRVMSRSKAKRTVRGERVRAELKQEGIIIRAGSMRGLAEEAPLAYKAVDGVVGAVVGAGIARKVARLRPLAVIKG
jgi:tRNA-splicing ligase RtcB